MPQLPLPPAPFGGASPTTKTDGAGTLWLACFANKAERVYKLVAGIWVEVLLEHTPTARGVLDLDGDGRAYLTAWDDGAKALWRILIPGFVPVRPPAQTSGLTPEQSRALAWLMGWLAPLIGK